MAYEAIVTKIHTHPFPGADKLVLGNVAGYQVITSKTTQDGQLGVFFPSDGCLSHEFCYHNSEYRTGKGENKDPNKSGYFEENHRVRTLTLRGAKSDGYWVPMQSLLWTGLSLEELCALKEGYTFTSLNGKLVCEKYYTAATRRAMQASDKPKKVNKKEQVEYVGFERHFDTKQLRHYINSIPVDANIIITEKLHGTSGRTAHLPCVEPISKYGWFATVFIWLALYCESIGLGLPLPTNPTKETWKHVSGTRRTILEDGKESSGGFYSGTNFRQAIHNSIALRKGETIYYEIVGYQQGNKLIMPEYGLNKKDPSPVEKALRKQFETDSMAFTYGCKIGEYKVYVYRITQTTENHSVDLSWEQVKARCKELGLDYVPEYQKLTFTNAESLLKIVEIASRGASSLDSSHISEGVCIRVEDAALPGGMSIFKYKSFQFCDIEGIAKNTDSYVDLEEVS